MSSSRGPITRSIHATDAVHHAELNEEVPEAKLRVRGQPARTTVNEGIRSLSWEEAGVAYVIEVECEAPFEDARCTEADYIQDLAASLTTSR